MAERPGVWLCRSCVFSEDGRYIVGSVARDGICTRCGGLAMEVFLGECQDPRLAVTPPAYRQVVEFIPTTVIERWQPIVWDVNGYYADLGVATDATKRDIMRAYQALDGQSSVRLTYVVKQLLNDGIRARYDRTPLGSVFFDHYLMAKVKQRIIEQVTAARLEAGEDDLDSSLFEEIDLDHLLNDRSFEVVDTPSYGVDDQGFRTGWGYYLWQSGSRQPLAAWHALLGKAFTDAGVRERIAVGFHRVPEMGSVAVTRLDHRTVVFFDDRERPTLDLAQEAVRQVQHPHQPTPPTKHQTPGRFQNEHCITVRVP